MSYDLFLFPRLAEPPLAREAFLAAFAGGEPYAVEGDEVRYHNDDTGVSFRFTYHPGDPRAGAEDFRSRPYSHFNMGFCRPHYFALEAGNVVTATVDSFSLIAHDPQGYMPTGAFDEDKLIEGWGEANRGFIRLRRELGTGHALSLPGRLNEEYWLWNYFVAENTEDLQRDEGIEVFVPRIRFCREAGRARAFALFPNLIPTDVPKVDYVLVLRNELPGPLAARGRDTPAWVRWEELIAAATGFELRGGPPGEDYPHLVLADKRYTSPQTAPARLAEWVIGLPDWPGRPDVISPEQILDAELLGE